MVRHPSSASRSSAATAALTVDRAWSSARPAMAGDVREPASSAVTRAARREAAAERSESADARRRMRPLTGPAGAIAATIGAGLAVGGLWFGVRYLIEDWLAESVRFVAFIGTDAVWTVAPALVAVAIGLAAVSSIVTLSRYTRV